MRPCYLDPQEVVRCHRALRATPREVYLTRVYSATAGQKHNDGDWVLSFNQSKHWVGTYSAEINPDVLQEDAEYVAATYMREKAREALRQ